MPQPAFDAELRRICAAWFGDRPLDIRPMQAGGFSGGRLIRADLLDGGESFVVKSFVPGTTRERAAWVHRFMIRARAAGVREVPPLAVSHRGETVVEDAAGTLWEAVGRVAGAAVTTPDEAQVTAGMELLARVHAAVERLPGPTPSSAVPLGISRRLAHAERLRLEPWSQLLVQARKRQETESVPLLAAVAARLDQANALLSAAGARGLDAIVSFPRSGGPAVQPALRDVWSEHVLFAAAERHRVAGLVDFHAAAVDVPATDIARLLGSWRPPEGTSSLPVVDRWPHAVAAYERIRRLPVGSRTLINWLEASGILCGLDNWFRWVLQEHRMFPDAGLVVRRIERLLEELPTALETLSKCGKSSGLTP
jgi:Ser/Thr protein kinase RdoA (MazF antagonist)